jgi:hypothetical protein
MGANEHDQAEFDLAVRTAEAAVRVLTARAARSPEEAEAIEHAAADGKVIDLVEGTRRLIERRSSKTVA